MRLAIALALFTSLAASASARPDFLGFQIGCTKQEWQTTMRAVWPKAKLRGREIDSCVESVSYEGNNSLKGATSTLFVFSEERLISVAVDYRIMDSEEASEKAERLARMAEEKYGKMDEGGFIDKKWSTTCDGMLVVIKYTMNITEDDEIIVSGSDVLMMLIAIACTEKVKQEGLGKF